MNAFSSRLPKAWVPVRRTYKCYFFGYSGGVQLSSIGILHITGPNAYRDDVANYLTAKSSPAYGTFTSTPFKRMDEYAKLNFKGTLLGGHWGYANRSFFSLPAVPR